MAVKSLWGNLNELDIIRTPKQILEEQARVLTDATGGTIMGVVEPIERGDTFDYELDVLLPALNNYRYTILSIRHSIALYPVEVVYGLPKAPPRSEKCENEEQFVKALERILSSKEVRFVLSRLLSQAQR